MIKLNFEDLKIIISNNLYLKQIEELMNFFTREFEESLKKLKSDYSNSITKVNLQSFDINLKNTIKKFTLFSKYKIDIENKEMIELFFYYLNFSNSSFVKKEELFKNFLLNFVNLEEKELLNLNSLSYIDSLNKNLLIIPNLKKIQQEIFDLRKENLKNEEVDIGLSLVENLHIENEKIQNSILNKNNKLEKEHFLNILSILKNISQNYISPQEKDFVTKIANNISLSDSLIQEISEIDLEKLITFREEIKELKDIKEPIIQNFMLSKINFILGNVLFSNPNFITQTKENEKISQELITFGRKKDIFDNIKKYEEFFQKTKITKLKSFLIFKEVFFSPGINGANNIDELLKMKKMFEHFNYDLVGEKINKNIFSPFSKIDIDYDFFDVFMINNLNNININDLEIYKNLIKITNNKKTKDINGSLEKTLNYILKPSKESVSKLGIFNIHFIQNKYYFKKILEDKDLFKELKNVFNKIEVAEYNDFLKKTHLDLEIEEKYLINNLSETGLDNFKEILEILNNKMFLNNISNILEKSPIQGIKIFEERNKKQPEKKKTLIKTSFKF